MTTDQRRDDHPGEEGFLIDQGDSDTISPGTDDEQEAPRRARGLGTDVPFHEKKDSGFFGAGNNDGENDDNLVRETTPGYQSDKWDRGTIMPR